MAEDRVTLDIGGQLWEGWTEVSIRRSLETLAGGFDLQLTERWPDQPARRTILPGVACRLRIGADTVITGYVDTVETAYGKDSHGIAVRGRDATGDLVDCSATNRPGQWSGISLDRIVNELCAPFKVPVRISADTGAPFNDFRLNEGETVVSALERLCRMRAVLRMADGQGGLLLTRTGHARAPAAIVLGENVLSARGRFDDSQRFSEYTVKGQQPAVDGITPEAAAAPSAVARDGGMGRYRPLVIIAEDQGNEDNFRDRARWEATVRAGRARGASYTLASWRANGALWHPNTLVAVRDPFLGIQREMLISEVAFTLNDSGSRTELTVVHPDAFALIAVPEKQPVIKL
jgi:prophage tail gpP-like protein